VSSSRAFPGTEPLPACAFHLSDRDVSRTSLCAHLWVNMCASVCKTMHIPPISPVWAYQNGWPEEDGPPGERQFILYNIIYKISYLNFKMLQTVSYFRQNKSFINQTVWPDNAIRLLKTDLNSLIWILDIKQVLFLNILLEYLKYTKLYTSIAWNLN